jgi:hypothetical protein
LESRENVFELSPLEIARRTAKRTYKYIKTRIESHKSESMKPPLVPTKTSTPNTPRQYKPKKTYFKQKPKTPTEEVISLDDFLGESIDITLTDQVQPADQPLQPIVHEEQNSEQETVQNEVKQESTSTTQEVQNEEPKEDQIEQTTEDKELPRLVIELSKLETRPELSSEVVTPSSSMPISEDEFTHTSTEPGTPRTEPDTPITKKKKNKIRRQLEKMMHDDTNPLRSSETKKVYPLLWNIQITSFEVIMVQESNEKEESAGVEISRVVSFHNPVERTTQEIFTTRDNIARQVMVDMNREVLQQYDTMVNDFEMSVDLEQLHIYTHATEKTTLSDRVDLKAIISSDYNKPIHYEKGVRLEIGHDDKWVLSTTPVIYNIINLIVKGQVEQLKQHASLLKFLKK